MRYERPQEKDARVRLFDYMEVDLITGEELQSLAKEVVAQTPEIVNRMRKLLGE